jgi:hypothetical protein
MMRVRRLLGWAFMVTLGLAIVWKGTAEIIEPHFLLWFQPRHGILDAPSAGGTTLRLYADTRPHVGKIAGLQKGLVWVRDRRALVEEGYGFGCPILEIDGRAHLSRHAETEVTYLGDVVRLVKRYEIDTVDTPIRFLRRKYRPLSLLGVVVFYYEIRMDGTIEVEVDFSRMEREWSRAYLMNEQGASRFTRYWDVNGTRLEVDDIGIWQPSDTFVERACFGSDDGQLGFCVEPDAPAIVHYGRERYLQYNWRGVYYLSWSGIDIEIVGPRPSYRYRLHLEVQ